MNYIDYKIKALKSLAIFMKKTCLLVDKAGNIWYKTIYAPKVD
jgi:hypothetical protein